MVFSGYSHGFPHQWNWPQRYNWNIVESGVKHHKSTNQQYNYYLQNKPPYQFVKTSVVCLMLKVALPSYHRVKKKVLEIRHTYQSLAGLPFSENFWWRLQDTPLFYKLHYPTLQGVYSHILWGNSVIEHKEKI